MKSVKVLVFSNDDLTSNAQIHLDQPPGIYFVVVKTSNSTSTSKVILR
ncbi:MAG: T9SS type A sorting domain-containing protein [Lentimicrobiaceae bacterium]|nr:T9SS type A sorting domain-containing protein [Lentimicrobiaceae bacterium]MCP4909117.1 T9SS type A sorting domain-containing protein [Bacteroidota bacterium]MBT3454002.1 T9SS type A sorting domain-containing protein [Lentimicrobiaceae bacterium]MBT3819120.1 T9SS type A sorting domain-containing protein [Lentimicrobiaceae bacterium]MBT4060548.1 T9SS type A sorting domain-containing protein [Lentimicrobiaceae bacterium]